MNAPATPPRAPLGQTPVALRGIALPAEHGGWGLLLEPIVLGLVLAPSVAGAGFALAATGAFLARHPLKLLLSDLRRGVRFPRTPYVEAFCLLYVACGLAALAVAIATARTSFWPPVLLSVPVGLAQLAYDASNRGRNAAAELAGAVAVSATAPAIVMAAGWSWLAASALWALIAGRAVASVLYVRARLRIDRALRPSLLPTWAAHLAALGLAVLLIVLGLAPRLAAVAFLVLLVRAWLGLSRWRRPTRPQTIGIREMAFGLLTVVLLGLGYAYHL
jgi:hypothetical protein